MSDLLSTIVDIARAGAGWHVSFAQGLWHVMDGSRCVGSFRKQGEALDALRRWRPANAA